MYTRQQRREIGRNLALGMSKPKAVKLATGTNSPNLEKYAYKLCNNDDVQEAMEYWKAEFAKKPLVTQEMVGYEYLRIVQQCSDAEKVEGDDGQRDEKTTAAMMNVRLKAMDSLVKLYGLSEGDQAKINKNKADTVSTLSDLANSLAGTERPAELEAGDFGE
jgi:hypothetical protein